MKKILGFAFLLLMNQRLLAGEGRFYLWQIKVHSIPLLLYVPESKTYEEMISRYEKMLNNHAEMVELFQGKGIHFETEKVTPISLSKMEKRVLLIANHPKDYSSYSDRLFNFDSHFRSQNLNSMLLPIAYDLTLNIKEKRDFLMQLGKGPGLMVSMGSQDVDTSFYHQEDFHSIDTNKARDRFEIDVVKSYISQERGFFLGVCRGHQLAAVALGYQLIQDLPFHKGTKVLHSNHWHPVELKKTTHHLLSDLFPGRLRLNVNSLHHQSVVYKSGGPLELSALASDSTVEAMEFKNGKGLLLQFHPEYMANEDGQKILAGVVRAQRRMFNPRCQSLWLSAK
jgi:putative glutamine amidotransferase